jgi:hypothetical protein
METIRETKQETLAKYHEQTPEAFVHSLTIFDSYVPVTPEMATQPEYKMVFDTREQEVAVGIRGTLEEFATQAAHEGNSVTIVDIFEQFDNQVRGRMEELDETARNELLLVATKMRYNMQVRFDSANEMPAGARYEASQDSKVEHRLASSKKATLGSLGIRLSSSLGASFGMYDTVSRIEDYGSLTDPRPDTYVAPTAPAERDYVSEARRAVYRKTKGFDFDALDRKEQKRIARELSKELHPDASEDNNPELFKAVSAIIHPTKPNKGNDRPEYASSTPPPAEHAPEPSAKTEPPVRLELEAKPEVQPEPQSETIHGDSNRDHYETAA